MKVKLLFGLFLLAFLLPSTASANQDNGLRQIHVKVVLRGGWYDVYAEHGKFNGMPLEWYAYAVIVGLPYGTHPGMDISANYETLYAATDGVIEFAGYDDAYWPMHVDIRVTDGHYKHELHIYGHMSEVWVAVGQTVKRGDPIGVSGTAGSGPHLHFERRTASSAAYPIGRAIDPEPVLVGKYFNKDK